jgi:hypothetical protein
MHPVREREGYILGHTFESIRFKLMIRPGLGHGGSSYAVLFSCVSISFFVNLQPMNGAFAFGIGQALHINVQTIMTFFRQSIYAALLLLSFFTVSAVHTPLVQAQPSRVAFVTGDHSKIFFTDGSKLDSTTIIDTATVNAGLRGLNYIGMTGVSKLSVLAATSNGKTLMIAGHFLFPNRSFSAQDSADAIIQLDAPFLLASVADFGTKFKILKRINLPVNLSIPVGTIAQNDFDWFATWTGSQVGSPYLWFYHGHLGETDDGSATHLDSVLYPRDDSHKIQGDYHMTNLASSPGGNIMIAVIVDQLSNQISGPDFHAVRWEPHPSGPTQVFRSTLFTNSVTGKFHLPILNRDFNFGLGIRAKDNTTAEVLLARDSGADLVAQTYDYNGPQIVLTDGTVYPRSMIPTSEYFFDGYRPEVDANAKQQGNGGDIQFIGQSDSIIFVTHSAAEDLDYSKSRLRIGTASSASSKVLYDKGSRHPLHPVWMQGVPAAPPKHEYIALSTPAIDFGAVKFGKMASQTVTISNPSDSDVRVDSVKITGPNAVNFSVTTNPGVPSNLPKSGTIIATVTFLSSDPIGAHNGMLTVYFGGRRDSIRQVTLTGNAIDTPHVGVAMSTNTITSLRIAPNPMHASTTITLQAARNGVMQMEVRDLLGRVVYTVNPNMMTAGSTRSVNFDASAFNLPNGVYYLSASVAGEKLTRQIVIVK